MANDLRGLAGRLRDGWDVAYWDHGSVVVQSPGGYRERYATWPWLNTRAQQEKR